MAKNNEVTYMTLSEGDRLMLARDALRGRESDHFRLTVMSAELDPGRDSRLEALAKDINRLQGLVASLEDGQNQTPATP